MSEHETQSATPVRQLYDAEYYHDGFGAIPYERNSHWLSFFSGIASELVRSLKPRRVFDAGCAWGFLVEALWDSGVEAWGVDLSDYAIRNVRRDMQPYCRVASLTDPIPGTYDLITCIEVLEHMPEEQGLEAVRQMCRATDTILFSSSPRDLEEPTHFNVQPTIYWLKLFAAHGFAPDLLYDASFVAPHAFLVRRQTEPIRDDVLQLFSSTLSGRIYKAAFVTRQQELEGLYAQTGRRELAERKAELAEQALQIQVTENSERRREIADDHERIAHLERSMAQQRAALEAELGDLQAEFDEERNSPASKLIRRYREWMASHRRRRSWVVRWIEPPVLWMLRLARVAPPLRPPAPEVPVEQPPEPVPPAPALTAPEPPSADSRKAYQAWILENEPDFWGLDLQRRLSANLASRPKISVLTPVFKVPIAVLRDMIDSVRGQTYDNWELCLAHGDPDDAAARAYLEWAAASDSRIKVKLLDTNEGIAGNSNQALTLVTGEFLALLDHDDTLAAFALFETARLLNDHPDANFIYSDKDQLSERTGERINPLFKPEWSPDILLSANYLTHLCVMRTEHVHAIGGWRSETDGAQDWDLFLRLITRYGNVHHIPKMLYHWRQIASSVAMSGLSVKPYAAEAQLQTLRLHCQEAGLDVDATFDARFGPRLQWKPVPGMKVSIIFLSQASLTDSLVKARDLMAATTYPDLEMLIPVDEDWQDPEVRCVRVFSKGWSERVRESAAASTGDVLVFIDESVTPTEDGWLEELVGPFQDRGIGMIGAKLLETGTNTLRHCGIVFTEKAGPEYVFSGTPEHVSNEFGCASWYRDWSAVSGACFSIRRQAWDEIGGLSGHARYPRLDVQISLDVQFRAGMRVIYNPFARLYQSAPAALEQNLWPEDETSRGYVRSLLPAGDPFFSRNLECHNGEIEIKHRPSDGHAWPRGNDYAAESRTLLEIFDSSPEQVARSKALTNKPGTGRLDRITWFLPEFVNPYYGGVYTSMRFADLFRRNHGVESAFCVLGNAVPDRIRRQIGDAFPALAESSTISVLDSHRRVNELGSCDAAVATLWTTAYAALQYENTRRKFYLMQDDEALFYPAGSISALVDATYRFGFAGICNTVALRDRYAARGGAAEYFDPCVDTSVFYSEGRRTVSNQTPYVLFCYARPGHPRNCFELLAAVLRRLKEQLGDLILIVTAGADWDLREYGLEGVVQNLGLLGYRATAALYRSCDAGMVVMMTRHPSYLPMELMACGALVVTNRNPDTAWLLKDSENCLLADPTPSSFVERLQEGLINTALRSRITSAARDMVRTQYADWEGQAEKIYRYMRDQS